MPSECHTYTAHHRPHRTTRPPPILPNLRHPHHCPAPPRPHTPSPHPPHHPRMHPPSAWTSPHYKTPPPLSPLPHTPPATTQLPPLTSRAPYLPHPTLRRLSPPPHPSVPSPPDHGTDQTLPDEAPSESAQQANYQQALLELRTHPQTNTEPNNRSSHHRLRPTHANLP